MNNTTTTKFSLLQRAKAWWAWRQGVSQRATLRRTCTAASAAADRVPPQIHAAWVRLAPEEFPGLAVSELNWVRCSVALAQFFEVCRQQQSHGPCALPSKGADSVWHAWLSVDPGGLAAWQRRHFGQALPHREAGALGAPLEDCLARTWAGACRSQRLSPLGPRLPLLFVLDGQLGLPNGWAYRHQRGALVHRRIGGFGQPAGSTVAHAATGATGLVTLGLVSEAELREHQRRSDGGAGCGSGTSSDSGCDGGSSCGSSCGSGCGGGGD